MSDNTFSFKGKKVLVTICEDIWASGEAWVGTRYPKNPLLKLKGKKIDIAINLSASPFSRGKAKSRLKVAKAMVDILKAPVVYTNMVGAQDEVIFDGNSFAMKKSGKVVMNSSPFQEDLNIVDFPEDKGGWRESISEVESLRQALVLGIRDFAFKTGIERVHLGLSGGVDSAVVACLAVDAMGPNKVTMIAMPGPFSSEKSLELAKALSKNLGASLITSEINSQYEVLIKNLERDFSHSDFGLVNENAQARLRAVNLMAFANLKNSLLLNTSNKTEMAVGYSTLYGDLCGGLCPIGDLLKTEVYELARHYNMESELIPGEIISRPPTAELKANQKDSDSLPEYDILDEAVKKIVVECKPAKTEIEKWLLKKIRSSEFKRWQAPPVLRVSQHAFGRGRRVPIAHQAEF
jgi:NAD+ synthase (glutamine-hydrolysing)